MASASGSSRQEDPRKSLFVKHKYSFIGAAGEIVSDPNMARIGSGAFGTVYRVRHTIERKDYAAKLIDKKKIIAKYCVSAKEKIAKEARNLAKLNGHMHVVKYKQVDENDSYFLIVMELCQKSMETHFKSKAKTFSIQSVRQYFLQLAEGLEYLHSNGIVHRDLKQDNICFGSNSKLKLVDLGLATQFKGQGMKTAYKSTLYKPRGCLFYRAPECRDPQVSIDGKADVWSLGLVIAEMLCGWFIQNCPRYKLNEPSQNNDMRKFIISTAKKKDKVLGNIVSKMLQPKLKSRWTSEKLVQELKKIGLEKVKGRIVDTGFAPQVSKKWIERLLERPVNREGPSENQHVWSGQGRGEENHLFGRKG